MKIKKLKIGKLNLKNKLILAPMVDITNLPYRLLCRKTGASLCFTEMIYIDSIINKNKKTKKLMETNNLDSPIGIQVTGNNLESFRKAIPYLKKYDLVDINCGCPSDRIIGNKAGSFLLNNPEKIADIIKLLKSEGLTVTAKIRLGFKENKVIKIAKIIEKAGADAITIHGRLASQDYDVKADWNEIKKAKSALRIPVIANGDITSGKDAKELLDFCDGIMIARAAIGDPLVFSRISKYLKTGKEIPSNFKENIKLLNEYLKLCRKYKFNNLSRIKYIGTKFIKNVKNAGKQRKELMQSKSISEIEDF